MEPVIQIEHIHKTYGQTVAVDDISFEVTEDEIFGIVGPNGAGKTTTVESVIGLRQPDTGMIRVLGLDPQRQGYELRQQIGVQLQQAALPDRLKVWEALDLFASFYTQPADWHVLLEQWELADKYRAAFGSLSGGQRQRLFIALALANNPKIVVLDELTTGLDPQARRVTWDLVQAVREHGTTVVLVTHSMEEAERLCDRVAIIDQGRVVALDTPRRLIGTLEAGIRIRFTLEKGFEPLQLKSVQGVTQVSREGDEVVVSGNGSLMAHVAVALAEHGLAPSDLRTEQVTLEDVFLALTGRQIRS